MDHGKLANENLGKWMNTIASNCVEPYSASLVLSSYSMYLSILSPYLNNKSFKKFNIFAYQNHIEKINLL